MASLSRQFRPTLSPSPFGQNQSRRASKMNAHVAKLGGLGSPATMTRPSSLGDLGATLGGLAGEHIGGERGGELGEALGGFIARTFGGGGGSDRPTSGGRGFTDGGTGPCPGAGVVHVPGVGCVSLGDLGPGGAPAVRAAGGVAVQGAFGMPALQPRTETRTVRRCGPGMVLGKDNLCYPKAVLSRRSKFRKWRAAPRPPVSAADMKAIRRAARAKDRVANLGRDVGLNVSKTRGKSRAQIEKEVRLELLENGARATCG